jgi:hypothetical protein
MLHDLAKLSTHEDMLLLPSAAIGDNIEMRDKQKYQNEVVSRC